jgi:uncharacterized protein YjbI with pentapeptide repeats
MDDERQDKKGQNDQSRRFDQQQYDFLKRCSEKGEEGIKEWNKWREENPASDICLDEQDFRGWYLRGVNFMQGRVFCHDNGKGKEIDYSGEVYLRDANLEKVDAEYALFGRAHLERTYWAHARLEGCDFHSAHLETARLAVSNLDQCTFSEAILSDAHLNMSSLRGAKFMRSDLRGCVARAAITDGATIIWECTIDRGGTDFTGVSLDGIRVDPARKQLLEYNIRRIAWEQWHKNAEEPIRKGTYVFRNERARLFRNKVLRGAARYFWVITDYGTSTRRIVVVFFLSALVFGALYYLSALLSPPGFVSSILQGKEGPVRCWLALIRAMCYSIVTMTTLGFGGMDANCQSFWGHVLLTLQVLLGYVLLGALVTRFAVLFMAGGPAGRFAEDE